MQIRICSFSNLWLVMPGSYTVSIHVLIYKLDSAPIVFYIRLLECILWMSDISNQLGVASQIATTSVQTVPLLLLHNFSLHQQIKNGFLRFHIAHTFPSRQTHMASTVIHGREISGILLLWSLVSYVVQL